MKDTYVKPEVRSENLDPEALSCAGSGGGQMTMLGAWSRSSIGVCCERQRG